MTITVRELLTKTPGTEPMSLNEYQAAAQSTAKYPKSRGLTYTAMNLNGEAGEIAGPIAKLIRKGQEPASFEELDPVLRGKLIKEAGDVLWELSAFCFELGVSLEHVAQTNLDKLAGRDARGTIHGDGDDR